MGSVIREAVIDCADPATVAAFWAEALGWQAHQRGEYFWMSESGDPAEPGLALVFVPVPERRSGKNRVHLDLCPKGCDQAEEVERLVSLGARRVDIGQGETPWEVLADPEGNEFCVLARRID